MSALKSAVLPLCLSVGVHAGAVLSLAPGSPLSRAPGGESIEISYVEPPKAPPASSAPQMAVPKKKLRGIPVPRLPVPAEPVDTEPSDFQKDIDAKLKQQLSMLTKLGASPDATRPTERAKTSVEMLADPKKGRIYVDYFGRMKEKIQQTLHGRFARRFPGKGAVTLRFVVNSGGFLEKVAVSPNDTREDERLRDLAVQCLYEAAPFGAFPSALGSDRLVFDVTFFFDGR